MKNITFEQFLTQEQEKPQLDINLRLLLENMAQSCAQIAHMVSQGALADILGAQGSQNVQGEDQKKLDVISNDLLLENSQWTGQLSAIASEEMETVYQIPSEHKRGPYLLLFDPLDGSSNIDVNVSIGTIFSVLKAPKHSSPENTGQQNNNDTPVAEADFLQTGTQQVAAGYVVYGPQTLMVLTTGNGVFGFTLNKDSGIWVLTHPNIQIPVDTKEFAINVSNMRHWHAPVKQYIDDCLVGENGPLGKNYNMRWIASMVADVHRILSRGGVFMYPSDARPSVKDGKLRLMYEANPMSFIVEQAGGAAIDGTSRILEIQPEKLHQRISVILGSKNEVETIRKYHDKA